jgi:hypothetical protein
LKIIIASQNSSQKEIERLVIADTNVIGPFAVPSTCPLWLKQDTMVLVQARLVKVRPDVCFGPKQQSSIIELIVIWSCFRHQIDASGQRPDRAPNGIHSNYRRKQHDGLYSDAVVSAEIIKREKDATKK